MTDRFTTPSGVLVERTTTTLDFKQGIAGLAERLDSERGVLLSSGVEYPGRYSRWDIGFAGPPIEIKARGQRLSLSALNERGTRLLAILKPILIGPETDIAEDTPRRLGLDIRPSDGFFAEEDRSLQPSLFSPLRRLIGEFRGIDDAFFGLYGAFGYDLIFQFERIVLSHQRDPEHRDLHLYFPDCLTCVDRRKEAAYRFDYVLSRDGTSMAGADATSFAPLPQPVANAGIRKAAITSDRTPQDYAAMVDTARTHMKAGDIFEVVLSRVFETEYTGLASALYHQIRRVNPSPYEFFLQLGEDRLVGTSPEMFIRVEGDRIESCPISGTVRRGGNAMEDAERLLALLNSEKDEVELTMCTDVDRNDKSRVCVPGTVKLLDRRLIEAYAGLYHTIDHVEGRLRPGFSGIDAFLSHMWAVTLTGAPKKMAVKLIERFEASPRGWYGGAVGALLFNGNLNTGITIRTFHLTAGKARYRVGATLVWDSVGVEEEEETRTKSNALFRALADLTSPPPAPAVGAAPSQPGAGLKIVFVDNEDSFVHTLADYFRQTGAEVRTLRAGTQLDRLLAGSPDLVVHSPGPGWPEQFGVPDLVRALAERGVGQFGVCLGLQGMVQAFGGDLRVLDEPRHGKTWKISHDGRTIFAGLPSPYEAGAYHSLVAREDRFPSSLEVSARNETGLVMAIRHRDLPVEGVQFHPESILTMGGAAGRLLIDNVVRGVARRKQTGGGPASP